MEPKLLVYLAYLTFGIGLTVVVARTLFRHGKAFLTDVLGEPSLADSLNRLLVVMFFLISLGYVAISLRFDQGIASASRAVELLSLKLGLVLLGLGALHGLNLLILSRIRRRRVIERASALAGPAMPSVALSRTAPQPAPQR